MRVFKSLLMSQLVAPLLVQVIFSPSSSPTGSVQAFHFGTQGTSPASRTVNLALPSMSAGPLRASALDGPREGSELLGRGPLEPMRPFVPTLLEGKKALVTGGNRGIGEAVTVALVSSGAKVCVMASNAQAFEDMVERHGLDASDGTGHVHWVQADLREPSEAVRGTEKAVEWAGGAIDLLVNNAGICIQEDFMATSAESFDETMAINTRAPLLVSKVCLKGMIDQKYGKIVNITSLSAAIAVKSHAAYCASKAAMDGLMRGLVCDLSQHNIQVNNVAPIVAWSAMGLENWADPGKAQPMLDKTPLGRFVETWEIANMVVFLVSDACAMCNGQVVGVDGGYTCL